jgi:hypothetical protein
VRSGGAIGPGTWYPHRDDGVSVAVDGQLRSFDCNALTLYIGVLLLQRRNCGVVAWGSGVDRERNLGAGPYLRTCFGCANRRGVITAAATRLHARYVTAAVVLHNGLI